ncbi:DUF6463 family protein [Paucibacter sp. APW11]|uniref:DUF6463 family protein n=1 Tax=Roseateles aquae TaxID=3077235 RepID=A0ABU3P8U0_9BURK|nr:DUF6463 family protein [Paucibacter sp. APW11]MDT8998625.1 DUF6463 family protein [Paucibacter sp. APW11]
MNAIPAPLSSAAQPLASPRWIGPWLLGVAALHTAFGLWAFAPMLRQIVAAGWIGAATSSAPLAAASWFMLFGAPLALLAWLLPALQSAARPALLRQLGWGLLGLALLGISLMPASGFWLLLPPVWGLLRPGRG